MPAKTSPPIKAIINSASEVTGVETWLALGLIVFAAAIPIVAIRWWGRPTILTDFLTLLFVGLYIFVVITTIAIVILWGLGRLDLPEKFMHWLGAATVGEVAGIVILVVRKTFGGP